MSNAQLMAICFLGYLVLGAMISNDVLLISSHIYLVGAIICDSIAKKECGL